MTTLPIELDIPDHTNEIQQVDIYIDRIKRSLKPIRSSSTMSVTNYKLLYENISRGLFYVGSLSQPAFGISDKLEEEYFKTYRHAPELAKSLWQDHYCKIHKPYNLMKNRLFSLYEEIEHLFVLYNKTQPPKEI